MTGQNKEVEYNAEELVAKIASLEEENTEEVEGKVKRFFKAHGKTLAKAGIGVAVVAGGLFILNKVTEKEDVIDGVFEELGD